MMVEAIKTCYNCGKSFRDNKDLQLHISAVHEKRKPYECNICYKKFGFPGNLSGHKKAVHSKTGPFQCRECPMRFFKKAQYLKKHFTMMHDLNKDDEMKCDICNRYFDSKSRYEGHLQSAHGTKLQCDKCDKQFTGKRSLKYHVEVSHEQVNSKCNFCDKVFTSSTTLKRHVTAAHRKSNETVKCDICNK